MNRYFKISTVLVGLSLAACSSDTEYRYVTSLPALNNATVTTTGSKSLAFYSDAIVYDPSGTPVTFDKSQVDANTADKLVLKSVATGTTDGEASIDLSDLYLGTITTVTGNATDAQASVAAVNAQADLETKVTTAYDDYIDDLVGDLAMSTLTLELDSSDSDAAALINGALAVNSDISDLLFLYGFEESGGVYVYNYTHDTSDDESPQSNASAALAALLVELTPELYIGGSASDYADAAALIAAGKDASLSTARTDTEHRLVQGKGLQHATFGYVKKETVDYKDGVQTSSTFGSVDTFAGVGVEGVLAAALKTDYGVGSDDIVFNGKTVANLTVDTANTDLTGTAKLTFNDGNEKLDLSFNDWYDVSYSDGGTATLKWKNGVADDFKLTEVAQDTFDEAHDLTVYDAGFDAAYYGNGKGVSEAAGTFHAIDTNTSAVSKSYSLEGAFGGATAPIPLK